MEMRKSLRKLIPILEFVRDLFPYSLILYLILFLLENLFPGFVSNNFDLNKLLIAVLIFGFFFVSVPNRVHEEEHADKKDNILVLILSVLSFIVLLYKGKDMGLEGLLIAIGGSVLVAFVSLSVLYFPDKDIEEEPMVTPVPVPEKQVMYSVKIPWKKYRKYAFFGVCLLVIAILLTGWRLNKKVEEVVTSDITPSVTTDLLENEEALPPSEKAIKNVPVEVLNGGVKVGSASAIAKLLRDMKFAVKKVGDADRYDYQYSLIRFRPEEFEVANYLIESIKGTYPNIVKAPLDSENPRIILILGR